jgi:hypothetical protein
VLEAHELGRVDRDVLALAARRDRPLDDLDRLVKRDGVDPAAEDVRAQLVPAGLEVLLAYAFGDCFPQGLSLPLPDRPAIAGRSRMLGRKRFCGDPRPASSGLPNGEENA